MFFFWLFFVPETRLSIRQRRRAWHACEYCTSTETWHPNWSFPLVLRGKLITSASAGDTFTVLATVTKKKLPSERSIFKRGGEKTKTFSHLLEWTLPAHTAPPSLSRGWCGPGSAPLLSSLLSPLRLRWISWRMVSPSSLPGWIAPLKPGSLSADTGAGCPPLALLLLPPPPPLLDVTETEPRVKKKAPANPSREEVTLLNFLSLSPPPPRLASGWKLPRSLPPHPPLSPWLPTSTT